MSTLACVRDNAAPFATMRLPPRDGLCFTDIDWHALAQGKRVWHVCLAVYEHDIVAESSDVCQTSARRLA